MLYVKIVAIDGKFNYYIPKQEHDLIPNNYQNFLDIQNS